MEVIDPYSIRVIASLAGCGKTIFDASTGSHDRKINNVFNTCPVRPEPFDLAQDRLVEG